MAGIGEKNNVSSRKVVRWLGLIFALLFISWDYRLRDHRVEAENAYFGTAHMPMHLMRCIGRFGRKNRLFTTGCR